MLSWIRAEKKVYHVKSMAYPKAVKGSRYIFRRTRFQFLVVIIYFATGITAHILHDTGRASTARQGDLILNSFTPFHASFDSNKLVKNKFFKIKIEVTNTFPTSLTVPIQFQEDTCDGFPKGPKDHIIDGHRSIHELTQDWVLKPGLNTIIFPHDYEPLSITAPFAHDPGPMCFGIKIDPRSQVAEESETNNGWGERFPVVETMQVRVTFLPISFSSSIDNRNAPTLDSYTQFFLRAQQYLRATYPVSEIGDRKFAVWFPYTPIDFPDVGLSNIDEAIHTLNMQSWVAGSTGPGPFYDVFVGVYGANALGNSIGGVSFGTAHHAVVVDERWSAGEATAHEIAHALKWANAAQPPPLPGSEECEDFNGNPDSGHICNLESPGYWINRQCMMGHFNWSIPTPTGGECEANMTTYDFMQAGHPTILTRWVSKFTWEYLVQVLDVNCAHNFGKPDFCNPDPKVIGIRGVIGRDGRPKLKPWYTFEGSYDVPLDHVGQFKVAYLDRRGKLIAKTAFDRLGNISHGQSKVQLLTLKVPYVEGTSRVVITRDDKVLFSRSFSTHAPIVRVIFPNGREVIKPGRMMTIRWEGRDADRDSLTYMVFLSEDGGKVWLPISREVAVNRFRLRIPATLKSSSVLIKVIATDGVNTSVDSSDRTFSTIGSTNRPR